MNEIIDRGRATNNKSLTYEKFLQLDRGEENSKFFVR